MGRLRHAVAVAGACGVGAGKQLPEAKREIERERVRERHADMNATIAHLMSSSPKFLPWRMNMMAKHLWQGWGGGGIRKGAW